MDALTSKDMLPHFKKLLTDAVDKYYDEDIWNKKYADFLTIQAAKDEIDRRIQLTDFGKEEYRLLSRIAELSGQGKDKEDDKEYSKAMAQYIDFFTNNKSENQKNQEHREKEVDEERAQELSVRGRD